MSDLNGLVENEAYIFANNTYQTKLDSNNDVNMISTFNNNIIKMAI